VPQGELQGALKQLSMEMLGLNDMQIIMLMAGTKPDKRGRCDYRMFADASAPVIWALFDETSQVCISC
jgi:hypothetical protein